MSDINVMVQLELVDPFDIEPMLDKALQGRLAKVLKDAGAKGSISVRARMITSVASTKYSTINGAPVSLVGIHGKDELLVKGPSWAVERLANGVTPPGPDGLCNEILSAKKKLEEYLSRFESFNEKINDYSRLVKRIKKYEAQPELELVPSVYGGVVPKFETQLLEYIKDEKKLALLRKSAKDYADLLDQIKKYRVEFCALFSGRTSTHDIEININKKHIASGVSDVICAIKLSLGRCDEFLEKQNAGPIEWWSGWVNTSSTYLEEIEVPIKQYVCDSGLPGLRRFYFAGEPAATFFDDGMGIYLRLADEGVNEFASDGKAARRN